jgi:hypothetical protein
MTPIVVQLQVDTIGPRISTIIIQMCHVKEGGTLAFILTELYSQNKKG